MTQCKPLSGCSSVLLAAPCCWLLLAALGRSWLLLVLPRSWLIPVAPACSGCFWPLLAAPSSWLLLAYSWLLHVVALGFWLLLSAPGLPPDCSWLLAHGLRLAGLGRSLLFLPPSLADPGCSWLLLVAPANSCLLLAA